jgi:poly-gamma-glutamate capsule biosynthesis protein CapA/YwtB (metallophosphatase superfamily)
MVPEFQRLEQVHVRDVADLKRSFQEKESKLLGEMQERHRQHVSALQSQWTAKSRSCLASLKQQHGLEVEDLRRENAILLARKQEEIDSDIASLTSTLSQRQELQNRKSAEELARLRDASSVRASKLKHSFSKEIEDLQNIHDENVRKCNTKLNSR